MDKNEANFLEKHHGAKEEPKESRRFKMNVSQRRQICRGESVEKKSEFELKRKSFNQTVDLTPIMPGSRKFTSGGFSQVSMKKDLPGHVGQGEVILEISTLKGKVFGPQPFLAIKTAKNVHKYSIL